MSTVLIVTTSALALAASAWVAAAGPADEAGRFNAEVRGALTSRVYGTASAGAVPGDSATPAHYTIRLGDDRALDAVLLTRAGGAPPAPGRYDVADRLDESGMAALVVVGRTEHPDGVFRADSGTVTVEPGAPGRVAGRFTLYATGFLSASPAREDSRIIVTGRFDAAE
jgi:hypothetical protein